MTTTHTARVHSDHDLGVHLASCSCGWQAAECRRTAHEADADGIAHEGSAVDGETRQPTLEERALIAAIENEEAVV